MVVLVLVGGVMAAPPPSGGDVAASSLGAEEEDVRALLQAMEKYHPIVRPLPCPSNIFSPPPLLAAPARLDRTHARLPHRSQTR